MYKNRKSWIQTTMDQTPLTIPKMRLIDRTIYPILVGKKIFQIYNIATDDNVGEIHLHLCI